MNITNTLLNDSLNALDDYYNGLFIITGESGFGTTSQAIKQAEISVKEGKKLNIYCHAKDYSRYLELGFKPTIIDWFNDCPEVKSEEIKFEINENQELAQLVYTDNEETDLTLIDFSGLSGNKLKRWLEILPQLSFDTMQPILAVTHSENNEVKDIDGFGVARLVVTMMSLSNKQPEPLKIKPRSYS